MSKGSISKKENPTPEKGIRNNEKEEEEEEELDLESLKYQIKSVSIKLLN
jgi:hypothetical protein